MAAVEWLAEEIELRYGLTPTLILLIRDAKEKEKQQIIDACYFGSQNLPYEVKDKSEQYYNEKFENK
jgi:hypothetical protein